MCFVRGEELCPLKGDRDALIERMMASDGVVFASPNYSFQVSAIMKAFLDRLGFLFHRPRFHGKSFTGIVVQGFHGGGKIARYLNFVGRGLGFRVVKSRSLTALVPMTDKEQRKWDKALSAQSRRFHDQLSKPSCPVPSLFWLMVFRMARTSIGRTLGVDSLDYTYYRDRGWFEADYYYAVRLGPLKKTAGAAFDWIFARVYKRRERPPACRRAERPLACIFHESREP